MPYYDVLCCVSLLSMIVWNAESYDVMRQHECDNIYYCAGSRKHCVFLLINSCLVSLQRERNQKGPVSIILYLYGQIDLNNIRKFCVYFFQEIKFVQIFILFHFFISQYLKFIKNVRERIRIQTENFSFFFLLSSSFIII